MKMYRKKGDIGHDEAGVMRTRIFRVANVGEDKCQLIDPTRSAIRKVCVVGASGKLGTLMVEECLKRGYEVVGVCREESVGKLNAFKDRITIVPGRTNNEEVIKKAIAGCDGVLTVLVPMGFDKNRSGIA